MSHATAPARPAPPAASAPAAAGTLVNPVNDTAERLYIQLVAKAAVVNGNTTSVPVDATVLAKLCFDLSNKFHEVEVSKRAKVEHTVANFDANLCDFDAWAPKTVA